jgi:hypothetical protein
VTDDDTLTRAAAIAGDRLPGYTGKYVGMLLSWEARTREPFSAHTQIADKLAAAILALPSPAVDREGLIKLLATNALHRYESEYNADHLTWHDFADAATEDLDALISAGVIRSPSEPDTAGAAREIEGGHGG